jgi:hypothetical protein
VCAEKTFNSLNCSAGSLENGCHRITLARKCFDPISCYSLTPHMVKMGKSIPPERLLRALLVQLLYSVRSEGMLMEQLEYNLLFRWFVGLSANVSVWHPTVFTENHDWLLYRRSGRRVLLADCRTDMGKETAFR